MRAEAREAVCRSGGCQNVRPVRSMRGRHRQLRRRGRGHGMLLARLIPTRKSVTRFPWRSPSTRTRRRWSARSAPRADHPVARKDPTARAGRGQAVVVIPFTAEVAAVPAASSPSTSWGHAARVCGGVGEDFTSRHATGTWPASRPWAGCWGSSGTPSRAVRRGARLSSSRVRELLAEGDVAGAAESWVAPHRRHRNGDQRGAARPGTGLPTANLACRPNWRLPATGVYAGWLIDGDADRCPRDLHRDQPDSSRRTSAAGWRLRDRRDDLDLYDREVTGVVRGRLRAWRPSTVSMRWWRR